MIKRSTVFSLVFFVSINAMSAGGAYFYRIRPGDCVSNVIYRIGLEPIYGKKGYLLKLAQLNLKHISEIDKIKPGQKVYFSEDITKKAQELGVIEIVAENEIRFRENERKIEPIARINEIPAQRNLAQVNLEADAKKELKSENLETKTQAEPQPQPETIIIDKIEDSRFLISLGSGYSRIDSKMLSTSAKATVLSKPMLGAKVNWTQDWSETFKTHIKWEYLSVTYKDANQGTIYNDKIDTTLFGMGSSYYFNPGTKFIFELGIRDDIFIPSYQSGTATLETHPITYSKIGLSQRLAQVRSLKLSGEIGGSYLFGGSYSGSYDVNPGQEYYLKVKFSQKLKSMSIFADAEYKDLNQNTTASEQHRKDLHTNIGVEIPMISGGN